MSLTNSPIWMSATAAGFYDYEISNSIRIGGSDGRTGRLKRTPASAGNRQTFTVSCWLKRNGRLTNDVGIFYASDGSNEGNSTNVINFKEGKLQFRSFDQTARLITNQLFRVSNDVTCSPLTYILILSSAVAFVVSLTTTI